MCFVNEKAVEKKWTYKHLQCVIVRVDLSGRETLMKHRCGYVRIPPGHPWHGKRYDDLDVRVHGGLTFAEIEPCKHEDGSGWWIGFDCAHFGDRVVPDGDPAADRYGSMFSKGHYWTLPEVQKMTELLARQVVAAQ